MQIKDIMSKKIVSCEESDLLSQALSQMRQHGVHQLIVKKGSELKGMLLLNDIVKREFDLSVTKVSNVMKPIPRITSDTSIEDAADLIINANVRALPVVDGGLVGIVSETDIIDRLNIDFDVEKISKSCYTVNANDNLGKIKHILVQKNVSRVPVLKDGNLVGVVGTIDLANILEQSKKMNESRGWGLKGKSYKEKLNMDTTLAGNIMKPATIVKKTAKAREIISLLKKHEEVFVVNGDIRIITPKDVLKLLPRPKKGFYFQIAGLEDEDAMTVAKLHKIIEDTIKPIAKANEIQPLHMYIEHHGKGGKIKYSIRAQLPTQIGTFVVSKVWGYNIITAMQEAMNNLDREFWKSYDKIRSKNKAAQRISRGK
ncbi:MAG: CBS domain-containing protein [Candidatus Aenigmatarchaeota archaeon]